MTEQGPIQSILIVGGGTAGWMAATYLKRFLRYTECQITLVESADVGTIGVGEATIPHLVNFIRNLRFDEAEFMRACHATYKLGIKFLDWGGEGTEYWHPFGNCGSVDGIDLFHFWIKHQRETGAAERYSAYSLNALVGEAFKGPRSLGGGPSRIVDAGHYAFHLDAISVAEFLKQAAVSDGVTHLYDDVEDVHLDPDGHISSVDTASGRNLSADLYIDCSGFRSVLMEGALGNPWIDWSHWLLCDRAVTAALPFDGAMHPYTRATALGAGWRWQIPLSHRVGCGYVYSSRHIDDDSAARELLESLPPADTLGAVPRFLRMRVGRRAELWKGNCVALGLAAGFIEPLESTGIHFIQMGIELLLDYFPERSFSPALQKSYNESVAGVYDRTRDFIILHYLLAGREDTRFWRDSGAVEPPPELRDAMALYDENGLIIPGHSSFASTSYHFVYSGNGHLPRRPASHVHRANFTEITEIMERIKVENINVADPLPTHQALMQALHGSRK